MTSKTFKLIAVRGAHAVLGWVAVIVALGGCSSAIALTQYAEGSKHPSVAVGEHRAKVESRLGEPVTIDPYADGSTIATYKYKVYRQSKIWDSPGERAIGYLRGVQVLFLSEVLFVPWEIGGKIYRLATRDTLTVRVKYGPDDTVVGVEFGDVAEPQPPKDGD